jgi:hypothetical protein
LRLNGSGYFVSLQTPKAATIRGGPAFVAASYLLGISAVALRLQSFAPNFVTRRLPPVTNRLNTDHST